MQDLRQDLRQHQQYGDGSRRDGRGGGTGHPGGADHGRGRGSFKDDRYERDKYERVQLMRKKSRASMRRRQTQALDISDSMSAPNVLAEKAAVLSAQRSTGAAGADLASSFDNLPHEPSTIMHDAFHTREVFHSPATAAQQQFDAGDLAVAVENALEACKGDEIEGNRITENNLIRSKIGGKFIARPDQEELVRKSMSGTGRKN